MKIQFTNQSFNIIRFQLMRIWLGLFLCLISFTLFAQNPPGWQWVQSGGGEGYPGSTVSQPGRDVVTCSAIDKEGNIIVGGYVSWVPIIGTDTYSVVNGATVWGGETFFLAKYDACGDYLWSVIGGGSSGDYVFGLDVDGNGNIYTIGLMPTIGTSARIYHTGGDTIFAASNARRQFFAKFNADGVLTYIKHFPTVPSSVWATEAGQFKRLKNGNFVSVFRVGAIPPTVNVEGFTVYKDSRNFSILDSLGNFLKVALIDTTINTNNVLSGFSVDDNENIYLSMANIFEPQLTFLNQHFNPAQQFTAYLIKTDTSFLIKQLALGPQNTCLIRPITDGKNLYCSGRNINGVIYQFDTMVTTVMDGNFVAYKMDTAFNLVWSSQATFMSVSPSYTDLFAVATKDNLYLAHTQLGTVTWGANSLVNPPGGVYKLSIHKLRGSDGVAEYSSFTAGDIQQGDEFTHFDKDQRGNPYFMGNFRFTVGVPGDTVTANLGSISPDFFILKWGLPCTDTLNSLNKPSAPQNLIATATGQTTINVTWQNTATYRLGFNLYRSPDGLTNWQQITTTAHNVYNFTDINLSPNTTYWYRVAAYTSGGESPFSNIDSATTFGLVCSSNITRSNTDSVYTFQANASGSGNLSYQWSNNGTGFSTAASPSLTLGTPGNYNICVTVTDALGCTTTDCETVIINAFTCNTTVNFTNTDSAYSFTTTNTGTGPFGYVWSVNGSNAGTAPTLNQNLGAAGVYNVCATVTDANNCQSSDCVQITITAPAVCSTDITYTNTGSSYQFSTANIGTAPYTYEWTNNNTAFSSSASASITLSTGSNNVCVSVTDANNCKAADCEVVVISAIAEQQIEEVEIYPNPVKDQLYVGIAVAGVDQCQVRLYDLSGKVVLDEKRYLQQGKNLLLLNLLNKPSGIYQLVISTGTEKWKGKVVKE